LRLKGLFYKAIAKTAILHRFECWAVGIETKQRVSIAKMRMFRWVYGATSKDRIRNQFIRDIVEMAQFRQYGGVRLRWFNHVIRRVNIEIV